MLSRRAALKGGTAVAASAAMTTAAGAVAAAITKDTDPVISLVDEIRRVSEAWHVVHDDEDRRQYEMLEARYWELRKELVNTPARTIRGVLAKLECFFTEDEMEQMRKGEEIMDDLPRDYTASVFRDLERLAGRASS